MTGQARAFKRQIKRFTASTPLRTSSGVGSVPVASGLSSAEYGDGFVHTTRFTLNALSVTMTDNTTNGSQGSQKLYDFPEGAIRILGVVVNLTIARVGTNLAANAAIVGSVGTVAAANTNGTLTGTEADIVPSAAATLSSGAGTLQSIPSSTLTALTDNSGGTAADTIAAIGGTYSQTEVRNAIASLAAKINALIPGANVFLDGTAGAKSAFLNFAVPDAGTSGNDALTVNGTVTLVWIGHGDK